MRMPGLYFRFSILTLYFTALLITGCNRIEKPGYDIPSVSLSILSEKPFTIGDPIDIALSLYHNGSDQVIYPKDKEQFLPFALKEFLVKREKITATTYKTLIIYTVTSFQTGSLTLDPLQVHVGKALLKTEPLSLQILSVLPKDDANPSLRDIVPPYRARIRPLVILTVLSSLVFVYFIFFLLYRYFKKKRIYREPLEDEETLIDPYQFSILELENLKNAYIKNESNTKEVYAKLSHVLKYFIGSLLKIKALEMTTGELDRYLKKKPRKLQGPDLFNILKRSDLVKFAKERIKRERTERDIEKSVQIVRKVVKGEEVKGA